MPSSTPAYQARPRKKLYFVVPAVAAVVLAAYVIGRWTAEPPPAPSAAERQPEPAARAEAALVLPPAMPRPAVAKPAPVPAAAPSPPPPPSPTEIVTRVTEEAKAQIEVLRPKYVSRCWPSGGLRGGRNSANVTFNIVFDSQGREVMRGISEDRRAPAGEFARCLREMEGTMSIEPPGTGITVSVPVTFP